MKEDFKDLTFKKSIQTFRQPFITPMPDPLGNQPPLPDPIDPEPIPFPEGKFWEKYHEKELPKFIPKWPPFQLRSLKQGCYFIRYTPLLSYPFSTYYDGTMRVQREGTNTIASGDLYLHQRFPVWRCWPHYPPLLPLEPNPANGIPIFPISRYRYYLRVTKILEWYTFSDTFTLEFEMYRLTNRSTNSWTNDGKLTARMKWTTAPAGYPDGSAYLSGEVKNSSGAVTGNLTMGWVSEYYRRATVELDRVSASESPINNGLSDDWQTLFDEVGWDLHVEQSDTNISEPSGNSWSDAEMHQAMLNRRDSSNLDAEWRYYLLSVRNLDSTSRGIMYDAYGGDSNNIPREGAGISSHWVIPNTNTWGRVRGLRFGTAAAPYFRTGVHEIGHAMGLYHNTADNGFMNTTGVIAGNAVLPQQFPDNVQWRFAPDDQKRLRHFPDIWVRPGGIPFGSSYFSTPISPNDMIEDASGFELKVAPLLESVPIGAPVRIEYSLKNTSEAPLPAPVKLGLKHGSVKGKVVDPSGTVRTFSPLLICIEEAEIQTLKPGKSINHSATLLRGAQGALFASPGAHRIILEIKWDLGGFEVGISSETSVMITPPVDEAHSKAALKILSSPDALLTLAFGGDHLQDGIDAIQAGLKNSTLRSHFSFIEAKRKGERFGKRNEDLKPLQECLNEKAIMSQAEVKRSIALIKKMKKESSGDDMKKIIKSLNETADRINADDKTKKELKSL